MKYDLLNFKQSQKPNPIIVLLYIVLWKIYKNYCVKCKYKGKQTYKAAASLETIQVLKSLETVQVLKYLSKTQVQMSRFALQKSNVQMFLSDLSSEDEKNLAIVHAV